MSHLVLCALLALIYYSSQVSGLAFFSVAAPIIWNTLPFDIPNSSTISCFRRRLKTVFYKAAFQPPWCPIPSPAQRLRFSWPIADIVCFTNSFTYLVIYLLLYAAADTYRFVIVTASESCRQWCIRLRATRTV